MPRWTHTEQRATDVSAEQVWKVWTTPALSARCGELEWVRLEGEFGEGARGSLKPSRGPEVRFTITDVVRDSSFVSRSRMPGAAVNWHYRIEPGTISTTVEIVGPMALVYRLLLARRFRAMMQASLPRVLELASRQ